MRRPLGVVLAGIFLGVIALIGIPCGLLGLGVSIFSHSKVIPNLPGVRPVMIGSATVQLAFFIFCAWAMVELFRLRRWARTAALVIAGIVAFFSATSGFGILMARKYAAILPPGPAAGDVQTGLIGFATFCFCVSLIAIFWLVYFNLSAVRSVFSGRRATASAADGLTIDSAPPPERGTPGWRIVIMVWAWLILVSVLYLPMLLWRGTPMFLFGAVLRGWVGTTVLLIFWVIEIYMAIGLLRKWKPAWYVALIFQIYAVGYSLTFLLPGVRSRFLAYMQETMAQWSGGVASPDMFVNATFIDVGLGFGLILVLVLAWALIQRREDYLGA